MLGCTGLPPGLTLDYIAKHSLDFWLTTEDLPHANNRATRLPDQVPLMATFP